MTDEVKEENTYGESKSRSSEPSYRSTIPIWKCIWSIQGVDWYSYWFKQ